MFNIAGYGEEALAVIKIEDSPSPEPAFVPIEPTPVIDSTPVLIDPRDPECFLKRCSGFNKKTKLRCNSVIGKKSEQSCHPTFLPTCRTHRDQQSFAGWCQYQHANGERCSRLFRWTPPYFELCTEHQGHPDTPCYFFRLPLELRHEVFRYLLPDRPIGSSTAQLHNEKYSAFSSSSYIPPSHSTNNYRRRPVYGYPSGHSVTPTQGGSSVSVFPIPALDLFLVNRQFYYEVKDLLFSTVPFTIDVRKDGTFMCGRRLLEPRRADGSSHFMVDEADEAKQRFLKYFDWAAVKHYKVDILVENWANGTLYPTNSAWDEEVELYDIRDYISVVVSGVLAKSRNLCKLQVRLCLADFDWTHEQILANTKLIVGPFESLRNVRQPQIIGIFMGKPNHNAMLTVQRPASRLGNQAPICSVPSLPTHTSLLVPGMPEFDTYTNAWTHRISSSSSSPMTKKAPIRGMFTAFKDFYSDLSAVVPAVTYIQGRHAFLHRARVAREQEDVESFRHLRNELIQYWYAYLEQEEKKKDAMNARLSRMLDTDVYPSHEWVEAERSKSRSSNGSGASRGVRNDGRGGNDKMRKAQQGAGTQSLGCSMVVVSPPSAAGSTALLQAQQQSPKTRNQQSELQNCILADFDLCGNVDDYYTSPEHHIDSVDVACFAHVNLSADWYAEPGPSTKKRRVDSGFSEMSVVEDGGMRFADDAGEDVVYIGKGKGKMGAEANVEVICID